jgi:hypothetical protein
VLHNSPDFFKACRYVVLWEPYLPKLLISTRI